MNTTTEGNKLIAVSMGGEIRKGKKIEVVMIDSIDGPFVCERVSNLKYHTSWNWLIPAVEKFCRLKFDHVTDRHYHKQIATSVKNSLLTLDILNVWNEMVIAAKWYNQIKKQ